MKTLEQLIAQIKEEILQDIRHGRVPVTVATFSELHDYVDANCYGGLCDDDTADAMIDHFGGRDVYEGMPDGMLNMINGSFDAVDAWLAVGDHHEALKGVYERFDGGTYDLMGFDLSDVAEPRVVVCRDGGGFVMKPPAETFFNECKLQGKPPTVRAFLTGMDGTESVFIAYSNGHRWNGWAVPMFEKDQLDEIILLFDVDSEKYLKFNEVDNVVEYYDHNENEWIKQAPEMVDVDMGNGLTLTKKLYPLGDGWAWDFYGWWADLKG